MRSTAILLSLAGLLFVLPDSAFATDQFVYPDAITFTFMPNDEASAKQGVKKCEISVTALKPTQGIDLRVKLLSKDRNTVYALTLDVAQFTVSNGIPYDPKKRAITSFRIVSNIFDTGREMKFADMHDGGILMALDQVKLTTMLKLVQRGDYFVSFKPVGALDETVYVIRPGADKQPVSQFFACIAQM